MHLSLDNALKSRVFPKGLLDKFSGSAVAYSLRKLSNVFTGFGVEARRSGDNTEANVSLPVNADSSITVSSGSSLATTFGGFVTEGGNKDAFIDTWYDQSGNARNATQSNSLYQPKIADSGTVNDDLDFDGTDDTFSIDVGSSPTTFSIFFVAKVEAFTGSARIFQFGTGSTSTVTLRSDNGDGTYEIEAFIRTSGTNGRYRWDIPVNQTGVFSAIFDYSNLDLDLYLNGSLLTRTDATVPTGTWTVPTGNFLNISGPGVFLNSSFKELIFYPSDQSANRTAIEDDINSYYAIYS
jgi:hypothetical protein